MTITIAILGQSPMEQWNIASGAPPIAVTGTKIWSGSAWIPPTGDGLITFCNALNASLGEDIKIYMGAVGGSCLAPESVNPATPNNYWLCLAPGSPLINFITQVTTAGILPDLFMIDCSHQDAYATSRTRYYLCARALIAYLHQLLGLTSELPFFMAIGGVTNYGIVSDGAMNDIRAVQSNFWAFDPKAHGLATYLDLPTSDGVHPTIPSYCTYARRCAATIANYYDNSIHTGLGPYIQSATIHEGMIMVKIHGDQDDLSALNSSSNITGFEASINDFTSNLGVSFVHVVDKNTIGIVLNAAPASAPKIRYQYGKSPNVSNPVYAGNNPFSDSLGLPLQPAPNPIQCVNI